MFIGFLWGPQSKWLGFCEHTQSAVCAALTVSLHIGSRLGQPTLIGLKCFECFSELFWISFWFVLDFLCLALFALCDVCSKIATLTISSRLGQSHLIGSLLYPPALLSQWELWKWKIIIAILTPCHYQIANFLGRGGWLLLVSWKNSFVFKYWQGCQSFIKQSL